MVAAPVKGRKAHQATKPNVDPGLSREVIISAALAQIDEEGLAAFSLRTLANRLGVYPTAVYWYVPNRNELMAQVVTSVLRSVDSTQRSRSWKLQLRRIFSGFREAVRLHPNVAPLIGTELVSNSSVEYDLVESILDALTRAGLSGRGLVATYNGVIAALVGFIAQEFAPLPGEKVADWQAGVEARLGQVDPVRYPILSKNMPLLMNRSFILRWKSGSDAPLAESLEAFVDVLIEGIEALARRG